MIEEVKKTLVYLKNLWHMRRLLCTYVLIEKTSNFFFVLRNEINCRFRDGVQTAVHWKHAQVVSSHYGLSATLKKVNIVSDYMCGLVNVSN